jgi:hypothetical protein
MPGKIYAHDWSILGEDRIPRWPSKIGEKRPITVRISTWIGTSAIGARHYNVSVEEEVNQWWCEKENAWVELSCDPSKSGVSMSASVLSRSDAEKLAKFFVDLVIKDSNDYIVRNPYGEGNEE